MGRVRGMEEFRERQAERPPEVPTNIERRNKRSVQRSEKAASETGQVGETGVPDSVRDVISSTGRSLDASIQRAMEDRMGDSFGDVQVHTGPTAASACESINARAFTVGNHIAFNSGEYDPNSAEGQHVLAHELAHVRQQTGGAVSMLPQEGVELEVDPDPALEREAEETAQRVMQGGELGIQRLAETEVHVQRIPEEKVFEALTIFKEENESGDPGDFQESQNQNRFEFLIDHVVTAMEQRDNLEDNLEKQQAKIKEAEIDAETAQAYAGVPEHEVIEKIDEDRTKGELIERSENLKQGKAAIESRIRELTTEIADKTDQVALTDEQRQKLSGVDTSKLLTDLSWTVTKGILSHVLGLGPLMIAYNVSERVVKEVWNNTSGDLKERAAELEEKITSGEFTGLGEDPAGIRGEN